MENHVITLKVRLKVDSSDPDFDVEGFIHKMTYSFDTTDDKCEITDSEIMDYSSPSEKKDDTYDDADDTDEDEIMEEMEQEDDPDWDDEDIQAGH